jgi:two-component sensor histidine kinase
MPHDETPMVDSLRNGNSYHNLEVQVEQPSGRKIWIMVNIDPLRNQAGDIVGVINCFQEITDRKLADERQNLLINELNHRVKNTLATIQSIAAYTFRDGTGAEAPKWFEGRLLALSRAHDVLTQENWEGANLKDLIPKVAAPLNDEQANRFVINGPDVLLPPKLALSLSIALHELCTNAAKYGALSSTNGYIEVNWSVQDMGENRVFEIVWVERNGPEVTPPKHRGFGTRVIERTLAREHDAKVNMAFLPGGLRCEIGAPIL